MSGQIEGRRPILEALRAGRPVAEILLAGGMRAGGVVAEILKEAESRGVPVREVPRRRIEDLARSRAPQGAIALVGAFTYASVQHVLSRAADRDEPVLVVALDGVTDPHNVGALARSAEAAGAHGLLLPRRRSAPVTPVVEKVAAGALAHLPVAQVDNLGRVLVQLKERGVWIAALTGAADASIYELELATEPLCLVVGSEGRGVSRLVAERADVRVRIPMAGSVESLNASVAGAVALFEIVRRRRAAG